jgi:hypothetical protein
MSVPWRENEIELFKSLPQLESFRTNALNMTLIFPHLIRQRSLTTFHAPHLVQLVDSTGTTTSDLDLVLASLSTDGNVVLPNVVDIDATFWLLEHIASGKVKTLRTIIRHEDIGKEEAFFRLLRKYKTSLTSLAIQRRMDSRSESFTSFVERLAETVPLVEDLHISCHCLNWMVSWAPFDNLC